MSIFTVFKNGSTVEAIEDYYVANTLYIVTDEIGYNIGYVENGKALCYFSIVKTTLTLEKLTNFFLKPTSGGLLYSRFSPIQIATIFDYLGFEFPREFETTKIPFFYGTPKKGLKGGNHRIPLYSNKEEEINSSRFNTLLGGGLMKQKLATNKNANFIYTENEIFELVEHSGEI